MQPELRERREKTWKLLAIEGLSEQEVSARLSDAYGVTKETVREDIEKLAEWLPELDYTQDKWAYPESRLRELRLVRRRLHGMAEEAKEQADLRMELDIYREVIRTLNIDEEFTEELDRDGKERRFEELFDNDRLF